MTTPSLISETEARMQKTIGALKREMNTIRTGRASPALVENLAVDYYGVPTPLNQLATITTPEARMLLIQPWERGIIPDVEKSVLKSGLGLNPSNDGTVIRLPIPQPTEERRRELVKLVKKHAEEARVALRNIRRDTVEKLRAMERNKELPQDEAHRYQDQLQRLTDSFISQVDSTAEAKEAEVMEV